MRIYKKRRRRKWDGTLLGWAQYISTASKDPSTKVGAIIADQNNRVTGMGYNGFAIGVKDTEKRLKDRCLKYSLVLHAETNALLSACKTQECTIYVWPMPPCSQCMSQIIQSGIVRVVAPAEYEERWRESVELGLRIAWEAGVEVTLYRREKRWLAPIANAFRKGWLKIRWTWDLYGPMM